MNLLAIVGSPRKGKATDTLVDKAIEGVLSVSQNCNVKKLHLGLSRHYSEGFAMMLLHLSSRLPKIR